MGRIKAQTKWWLYRSILLLCGIIFLSTESQAIPNPPSSYYPRLNDEQFIKKYGITKRQMWIKETLHHIGRKDWGFNTKFRRVTMDTSRSPYRIRAVRQHGLLMVKDYKALLKHEYIGSYSGGKKERRIFNDLLTELYSRLTSRRMRLMSPKKNKDRDMQQYMEQEPITMKSVAFDVEGLIGKTYILEIRFIHPPLGKITTSYDRAIFSQGKINLVLDQSKPYFRDPQNK